MAKITDEYMKEMVATTRAYTIVLLKPGSFAVPDVQKIIWEHGRRNFELRAEGKLSIVCPVTAEGGLSGLGIFTTGIEETKEIMNGDPAVIAGIFTYEVYPCRSFRGDALG